MDNKVEEIYSFYSRLIASYEITKNNLLGSVKKIKRMSQLKEELEEARRIINNEIISIQKTLKEDIDSLVTIAINIVYEGRGLEFALIFDKKPSGASEYKPIILERGEEFDPKSEQCGGVLDVISYTMRPILHSLEVGSPRPFIFSDEPFKFLGGGLYGEKAASMRKRINTELGIQEVVIAHDDETISTADRIYKVTHDGKKSSVKLEYPKMKRVRSIE